MRASSRLLASRLVAVIATLLALVLVAAATFTAIEG